MAWLEGGEVTHSLPRLERLANKNLLQFSYLGRGLPYKDPLSAELDKDNAFKRFFKKPWTFKDGKISINHLKITEETRAELGFTIQKWMDHNPKTLTLPYSESSSLITPRSTGGMAGFFKDIIYLGRFFADQKDHYYNFNNVYSGRKRSLQILNDMIYELDLKYLKHIMHCKRSYRCKTPQYHFPFVMEAIPESGWRTRCATVPWPTLVFMTEQVRQILIIGMKRDSLSQCSIKDNFRNLDQVCDSPNIESTDMSAATDNFSLEYQELISSLIERNLPSHKKSLEPYVRASFSPTRVLTKGVEPCSKWPGLDAFLQKTSPWVPVPRLYQVMCSPPEWLEAPEKRHFPLNIFSNELKEINNQFSNLFSVNELLCKKHTSIEKEDSSISTTIGELPMGWKRYCLSETTFNSIPTYQFSREDELRRIAVRQRLIVEDHYYRERVWDAIKSWYQNLFENDFHTDKLSSNGQHMSLPLSFVSLQAVNTVAIRIAKKRDRHIRAHAMGDDAIIGFTNPKALDLYHDTLHTVGAIINERKTKISHIGRFVFCEHTLDRGIEGRWCDLPRVRQITQPIEDIRGSRWTTLNEGISKWMKHHHRASLYRLKLAKYRTHLDLAIKYGYDPTLPVEFGGMEIIYPNRNSEIYRAHINGIAYLGAEQMLTLDHKMQRAVRPHDKFSYSQLIAQRIFSGAKISFNGEGIPSHEAFKLVVDDFLPEFLYEHEFMKTKTVNNLSPKQVGYLFSRNLMNVPPHQSLISETYLRKYIKKLRHTIRIDSEYLNDLSLLRDNNR
jgi:hypothetical protein